jgi:hypothetical protein
MRRLFGRPDDAAAGRRAGMFARHVGRGRGGGGGGGGGRGAAPARRPKRLVLCTAPQEWEVPPNRIGGGIGMRQTLVTPSGA